MWRRELVRRVAPQGPVLVTWANLHYLDFVLNWVAHVRALGVGAYLVGAMDDAILQARTRQSMLHGCAAPRGLHVRNQMCSKPRPVFPSLPASQPASMHALPPGVSIMVQAAGWSLALEVATVGPE